MDLFVKAVCFSLLASCVQAGGAALSYMDGEMAPLLAAEGANDFEIIWYQDTNNNPSYNNIKFEHIHTSTKQKRLIGKLNKLVSEALMTGYNLTASPVGSGNSLHLIIDTVRARDDGSFIATAISDQYDDVLVIRNLTVAQTVKKVNLKLADKDAISSKPADPIEMEAGMYPVQCVAEGSNPATEDVQILLDGVRVTTVGEAMIELMDGETTQYKTTVVGNITFPSREVTVALQCSATDKSGDSKSTSLDVSVSVPEVKDVDCKKTEAKEGDASVSLECVVDLSLVNATGFAFEIGKTGKMIEPGQDSANGTVTGTVTVTDQSATKSKVTLTLPKAEGWHFDTDFYLIIKLPDNTVRKETIKLNKEGGDGSDGNRPAATVLTVTLVSLVAMAATWLRY